MEQPVVPQPKQYYTEAEYLAFDEASQTKHEYRHGQIIPFGGWERDVYGDIVGTAGGTAEHGDIACNAIAALKVRLKGTPCKIGNSDVRLPRAGRYSYPDVSVTCGPRAFSPPQSRSTVANPQVIIEVLSESTADEDRGEKFREYIEIESLRQYVLVTRDRPRVETFHRNADGGWGVGPWAE